jgi:hypothetical protein
VGCGKGVWVFLEAAGQKKMQRRWRIKMVMNAGKGGRGREAALLFTATPLLTSVCVYILLFFATEADIGSPSTGMRSGLHILEVIFCF